MNKKTVTIIAIGLFVIIIVVATVFVSRTKTKQGSSSYSAAATETYAEDFSSAAFRDAGNTTADWDTDRGVLTLPRTAGAFYYADESTEGLETVFSPSIGNAPLPMTVSFDSLGQPYVAFRHYDFDTDLAQVLVGHWDRATGAWVKADGSAGFDQFGTTNRGAFGDLDLTSNDEPAVAWHEYDSGTTTHSYFYTRWDSAQGAFVKANGSPGSDLVTTETLDPLEGAPQERWVDLELDSQGRPNIAFMSWDSTGSDSETSFLRWDGSAYSSIGSANVSNNSGDTDEIVASFINRPEIVLALDSSDRPYILWVDDTAGVNDMFLVYGDSTTNNWKDITGAPYSEACLGTTCSATNLTSTASAGVLGGDIYFNSQGDPAVVWSELGSTTLTEIFYQRWDSATSTWRGADGSAGAQEATSSAVVAAAGGARNPSVRFDTRDYPVISYDASDVFLSIDVFVTRWNGTVFATVDGATPGATNVTNYGSTGLNWRTPLLALDALGNPAMTWKLTSPSLMLGFTHWLEPCEASSTAQSTSVITSQEPVLSATLETDATTNGGTITYQLSNDGGLTFSNVTPGTPHVFETIGSDVKWRSDITRGSTPGACPVIDALSINASTSPIVRIDSATPTEQSIKISRIRFPETGSSPVGLIARNDIYADALTISPLVNRTGGTILLNDPDVLLPEVLTELERALGPGAGQTVYIAGQTAAQSAEVEQQISDAGYTPRRLGDSNRLGTAVKIADEIVDLNPGTTTKVFVAEHALFADALVAGAVAGDILNDGKADPILLNQRGASTIDPFTNTFLTAHPEITAVELIGGEVALSAGLATTLTTNFPATTLDRTAGADRFATAVALMQKHVIDPDFIVVANGQKEGLPGSGQALEPTGLAASSAASGFFDALLAGPYSAGKQAALVLTKAQELPIPTQDYISSNIPGISHVLIIGSLELVSAAVEAQIEALFD